MTNKQKTILFTGQKITLIVYIVLYILTTFVTWDIENPFKWIIDLPTYEPIDRMFILMTIGIYYGILYGTLIDTYEEK